MKKEIKKSVVNNFNKCINKHDLDGLEKLMHEDHKFFDTEENVVHGKENCAKVWKSFFTQFPDYKNIFESIETVEDEVIIRGHSECEHEFLNGSYLWKAVLKDGLLSEWHVYEDTAKNRSKLYNFN